MKKILAIVAVLILFGIIAAGENNRRRSGWDSARRDNGQQAGESSVDAIVTELEDSFESNVTVDDTALLESIADEDITSVGTNYNE